MTLHIHMCMTMCLILSMYFQTWERAKDKDAQSLKQLLTVTQTLLKLLQV